MLRWGGRQLSAESIATDLQTSCGLQVSSRTESFMEWASIAEQLYPRHTSVSAMQSFGCSDVKHAAAGLGAVEVRSLEWQITLLHLAIWWTSLGLVVARRTVHVWLHCDKCKVWWRGIIVWGCFSVPVKRTLNASEHQEMLDSSMLPTLWDSLGMAPSCSNMTVHQCTKQGP